MKGGVTASSSLGSPTTDAQGRWRLDVAPKNLAAVGASVIHPRYRAMTSPCVSQPQHVIVLKKGLTVVGRVVDAADRPLKRGQGHHRFRHVGDQLPNRGVERAGAVHPGELQSRPDDHHGAGRGLRAPVSRHPDRRANRTRRVPVDRARLGPAHQGR